MKNWLRVAIGAGILLVGAGLAAYPFVSNYFYERRQKEVILEYEGHVEEASQEALENEWALAESYNLSLRNSDVILTDPFDPMALTNRRRDSYDELLNPEGDGMMGYLEIPALDLRLNIYHGTETDVLERGVGHLKETSLPIGGEGTHAVLSAHAGLPEKKLFTDLELMETGDVFYIHVLNEVLAYRTDQIKVVEPEQVDDLKIKPGKDYVTLVTCTPYGVNSHRLLVRGERIPYEEPEEEEYPQVKEKSHWMREYFYGVATGFGILLIIFILYSILRSGRGKHET